MAARNDRRRRRTLGAALSVLLALLASQTGASAERWVDGVRIPDGYRMIRRHALGGGLVHLGLTRQNPDEFVHVARLPKGSLNRLRMILSNDRIAGPLPRTERTSSMCRRTRCLIAVNGDFFTDAGAPVGGLIDASRPLRSPIDSRPQFSLGSDGSLSIGRLGLATELTTYHPRFTTGPLRNSLGTEPRTVALRGINVTRPANQIVLYTRRFGPRTETSGGAEIVARVVSPSGELRVGTPTTIEFLSPRSGNSAIPSNGVVLSGHGEGASVLSALWRDITTGRAERRARLQVTSVPDPVQSVAGRPVLVRNGERATSSASRRYARTMIGWNAAGDLLLVTVDGQQPDRSVGMSVIEAAHLMKALGAVDALNLDGGGSTTFVMNGTVVNRPSTSRHRERAVAVSVAILPAA